MTINDLFKKIETYNELAPSVNYDAKRIGIYIDIDGLGVKNPCADTYKFFYLYEFAFALFDDYGQEFAVKVLNTEIQSKNEKQFYIKTDEIDAKLDIWCN